MNLETKEKDSLIILVIVNFLIWFPVILILFFFIAVSRVFASPQYRTSSGSSWGEWTNANIDTDYNFIANLNTSWSSYIQLKDTVSFENNKTYNLNANLEFILNENGIRDMNSALDPYIFNGSSLTNVSDKCTTTGTRSDKTSTVGGITYTTHTYKVNVNCVGLKNFGYYPYLTIRFLTDSSSLTTSIKFNVKSWEYHVGTDSTDANNIMNNQNQNTQQIIENNNQNTQEITNAINNQYNVCSDYNLNLNTWSYDEGKLNSSGVVQANSTFNTSSYLRVNANNIYTYIRNYSTGSNYCLYDNNYNKLSCTTPASTSVEITPTQDGYLRISFNKSKTNTFTGTYCYNALEKESDQMDDLLNGWNKASDPDYSNSEQAFDLEEDLFDNMDLDFSNINIEVNTTSNNLIWTWITNILFGNTVLSLAVITLLVLNLLRFIVGR